MRSQPLAVLVVSAGLLAGADGVANAQTNSTNAPAAATAARDVDHGFDYGWLGLIGLAGLAGLRGNRHGTVTGVDAAARSTR